ncbi:MAG: polyisoprenoid-binding protein [Proteobacteria bacterium]|nr:polyisoprenoid-binding protein [Pseudomonadota bacterium]
MFRSLVLASALLFASYAPAHAEAMKYTFDPLHTQIHFTANHLGFSNSTGKFLKFDGSFMFDEARPADGFVAVTIDVNSLNMDDATWEEHLKAPDMFNAAQYSTMGYKSTRVEMTGEKTARLIGDLTLLGQTKPVTLDVTLNKCGEHPMNNKPTCGFSATGKLKRSDWGMTKGIPMVSDEIQLRIEVEASAAPTLNN